MTDGTGATGRPPGHGSTPGRLEVWGAGEGTRLLATGDWTLAHYRALHRAVAGVRLRDEPQLDLTGIGDLDTAGATLLVHLLGGERVRTLADATPGLSRERRALLQAIGEAVHREAPAAPASPHVVIDVLARMGRAMVAVWREVLLLLSFIGLILTTLARGVLQPRRWRITAIVKQMEETGLNAVPIVAILTFAVGAVVAYLGAAVLSEFGATIYTIDLVAYSFLREFGVFIAAILVAGRTASAFTAHIGSMKANEELDALRTQGLDAIELLVLPRVIALMVVLPMLTFIAMLSGLAGGAVVAANVLDIPLARFFAVLAEVPVTDYLVGLLKAPVFAFLIGAIGCLEGFKAGASAQSVGAHTTSSVVQAIFVVILVDALAAMFFMEIGW
ncbi:ABC transporter permease [Ectothiorhodospiraceae bacterium 2226]|nr:ABC transporter permease [Ectothiorhodospiraceae bacterium 2226]